MILAVFWATDGELNPSAIVPRDRKRDNFLNKMIEKIAIMPTLGIKVDEDVAIGYGLSLVF
jgi:hypothetical protein